MSQAEANAGSREVVVGCREHHDYAYTLTAWTRSFSLQMYYYQCNMKAARGTKMGQPSVQPFSGSMRRGNGKVHRIQRWNALLSFRFAPLHPSDVFHTTSPHFSQVDKTSGWFILQGAEAHRSEEKSRAEPGAEEALWVNLPSSSYFYLHSPCFHSPSQDRQSDHSHFHTWIAAQQPKQWKPECIPFLKNWIEH